MRIGDSLYLDHQATTPLDPRVLNEMSPYWGDSFGNPHSLDHAFGWQAARAVEVATEQVARLIGADSDELVFTSGATEANNLALWGLARKAATGPRRRILLGECEHKSILSIGRALATELGYQVEYLPVDAIGRLDIHALREAVDENVLVASIMAVNNEIGTIQEIDKLSSIIRGSGAIFHCDAAQAPCAIDLSSITNHVDLLSLSAHKMYGPKGIGALYVRRDLRDKLAPLIYGGGQQGNLRSGTVPTALCVGMGAAAKLFESNLAIIERHELALLRNEFVKGLNDLPWETNVNGPELGAERHPCNANVSFEGFSAHDILGSLQPGLAASTGSACTTGIPEPSHVLRAIGLSNIQAESSIRFSIGRFTTKDDVTNAVNMICNVLSTLPRTRL